MTLTSEQLESWQDNGYLLLKNFYTHKQIDQVNQLIDNLWIDRKTLDDQYVIDIFVGSKLEKRIHIANAPIAARDYPYKLNDLYLTQDIIREIAIGEKLAPILKELLDGSPLICNSLNFEFGSQQRYHFDTFFMPSPTPNKMVASWIALENATKKNGPLSYYPGSHKIKPYLFSNGTTIRIEDELPAFNEYIYNEINKRGLKPEILLAKKGDVLIWHSQLFHGGSEILNQHKTRKSLVTHYFTEEDFPEADDIVSVGKLGAYIQRPAQPAEVLTEAEIELPAKKKGLLSRLFN